MVLQNQKVMKKAIHLNLVQKKNLIFKRRKNYKKIKPDKTNIIIIKIIYKNKLINNIS